MVSTLPEQQQLVLKAIALLSMSTRGIKKSLEKKSKEYCIQGKCTKIQAAGFTAKRRNG